MTLKDLAGLLVIIISAVGWFLSWWNHRLLRAELRGVRGWKFRMMYRDFALKHDLPINGEDKEKER